MVLALALLAGCHRAPEDPVASSADEQSQLNNAAAMLDANSVSTDAAANSDDTP